MATGGTSVFVAAGAVPPGVCKRCAGWKPQWGEGRGGTVACVKTQHAGGEVRNAVCSRCGGTGVEPPHFIYNGVWYKPWTWLSWHYEDDFDFGTRGKRPPSYPLEQHN